MVEWRHKKCEVTGPSSHHLATLDLAPFKHGGPAMNDVTPTPERWLAAVGYEGFYEVSDLGRVRSLDRIVRIHHDGRRVYPGRILKPQPASKYGHLKVGFSVERSKIRWFQIHQLVLLAFDKPCPAGMEIRHLDSNPANNALTNLVYGTRSENARDRGL